MPRSRAIFLLPLLLAGSLISPAPAAAFGFAPLWTLAGWNFVEDVGNLDSDPQHELTFASKADDHLAIVDGLTGVIEKEFPQFPSSNTQQVFQDVDGDGRAEIFLCRVPNGPITPLTTAYHWNGSTYVTMFTHTDPVETMGLVRLRNATTYDVYEQSSNDIRVRNLAGAVLFQASTAVPGWSGSGVYVQLMDIDGDGVDELGAGEQLFTPTEKISFFNYSGGFVPAWSKTGWLPSGFANTDGDPASEIVMVNGTDFHWALFDGLTGTLEKDFPAFKANENGSQLNAIDTDGDGICEVFLNRPQGDTTTPLFIEYKWSAGTYTTVFSHTEPQTDFFVMHVRGTSQLDLLELNAVANNFGGDVRVRTLAGSLLYRASAAIAGWSGYNTNVAEMDTDHDGVYELEIQDGATMRFVRYAGTFAQSWSTSAWSARVELPVDGDPQSELLVVNSADQHYALLDPTGGAIEHEFPAFGENDSYAQPTDLDNDGRTEMLFSRFTPPLNTAYDWSPSGWTTLFSNNDVLEGMGAGHYRNPGLTELAELAPNDVRVRDASGAVIFLASTDLPGWTGANRNVAALDVNVDGVDELMVSDDGAVRLLRPTGLVAVTDPAQGHGFVLLASAPNPFRAGTSIRFSLPAAGNVGVRIYGAGGRLLRRLDDHLAAGAHEIHWDGKDDEGRAVPSGMLFYEVTANGARLTGRMVRLGS